MKGINPLLFLNRRTIRFVQVLFVALSVIGLETVAFQALCFVKDYMTASQVISVALLGISLGGILSFVVPKPRIGTVSNIVLFLLPFALMASFPIIIRVNTSPIWMMALLTAPYILASLYISLAFNDEEPGKVYLYDLVGAGIGAVVAVIAVPHLREEGSFFLLGILSSVPIILSIFREKGKLPKLVLGGAVVVTAMSVALLIVHVVDDPFNMVNTATSEHDGVIQKVFNFGRDKNGNHRFNLLYSRGSLIERIDIISWRGRPGMTSIYNGRTVDGISSNKAKLGALDYRLPTRLKLGENPDTLLVGPSGQGLCKAVQALGDGHVDAVEINGAIASLMTRELDEASGHAYAGFHLTVGDVRTFIERTDRKYDFITMLNTHRIWSMGHMGAPEYIHTVEAMREFVDHLKDEGYLILEERNINEQADLGIRRLLHTVKAALRDRGIEDPSKHIMVWERWHGCSEKNMKAATPRCAPINKFTFIGIKRTPITEKEYEHFIAWEKELGAIGNPKREYIGFLWQYLPQQKENNNVWKQVVETASLYDTPGTDRDLHNLGIITDDKPFPFDVFKSREKLWEMLSNVTILAILMVLIPAGIAFFAGRRETVRLSKGVRMGLNGLLVLYFGVLGIAYLAVEVVFIQKFGVFLSSPTWSLAVILSTMLVASGLGGYVNRNLSNKGVIVAFGILFAYGILLYFVLDPVLRSLMFLPQSARILAAVLIVGPIAFIMGIPFPSAIAFAKQTLTAKHAGLYFGINGAFGATATPLTILLSMTLGFKMTLLIGLGLYVISGVLLSGVFVTAAFASGRENAVSTSDNTVSKQKAELEPSVDNA